VVSTTAEARNAVSRAINRINGAVGRAVAWCALALVMVQFVAVVQRYVFGRESESGVDRADWDDVDDYHLWSASPPQDRSGTPLPNLTDWQRDVVVEWVDPSNPSVTVGSDQGVKRITVTVRRNGQIVAQDFALRSEKYLDN